MTRYTDFGKKRTYLKAGFDDDRIPEEQETKIAAPSGTSEQLSIISGPMKKKRKRTKKSHVVDNATAAVQGENATPEVVIVAEGSHSEAKTGWKRDKRIAIRASANEKRRLQRIQDKLANTTCFACRAKGHAAKDCPTVHDEVDDTTGGKGDTQKNAVGICYRCGSKTHILSRCKRHYDPGNPLPFASCFVCSGKGHLASSCPKNAGKGVYPNGGSCKLCGETSHLARNCELRKQVATTGAAFFGTGREAGADEDDFHMFKRKNAEVDQEEHLENRAKRKADIKVGAMSKTIKSFAPVPAQLAKKVVFF